jgi:Macrocin-O-methyltransferase (TylF)
VQSASNSKAFSSRTPAPSGSGGREALSVSGFLRLRFQIAFGQPTTAFARLNEIKASQKAVRGVDLLRALCFLKLNQPQAAVEALKEELRYFPANNKAAALLAKIETGVLPASVEGDAEFQKLYAAVRRNTMLSPARLLSLFTHARVLCRENRPGQFVECGVAAGGSSALLATVIARHSVQPRRLFSFDTFEGMPDSSPLDIAFGQPAEATGWGRGTCAAPQDSLLDLCRKLGAESAVEPVQGLFADTLPAHRARIGAIALLHLDGDWYTSTRDVLENLFDQVVPGGFIQIDDYGYWDGCRRAVTEFEQQRGLRFNLHRIDETGVWLVK